MMSLKHLLFAFIFFQTVDAFSQSMIDTIAFQDFEIAPYSPTWAFTGPVVYNSGISSNNAAPANSPIGINGSRAWETTSNSGGLILDFNNTLIPTGYDSIRINFKLAAMNLNGLTGGPDDLDYVLVSYSIDNGVSFVNRLRIRGALANNSFWGYDATGNAAAYYLPASESVFQPTLTGLATTEGYSNCEVVFPGSITQLQLRIIGRSSSSSDTWLIDNVLLTGESLCSPTFSTVSATSCNSYLWPQNNQTYTSSGNYTDTISNAAGCDSIITLNLTINNSTTSSFTVTECDSHTLNGQTYTTSGVYTQMLTNAAGCDSTLTLSLTINSVQDTILTAAACGSYTWPQTGMTYSFSGQYNDTILASTGCDSIVRLSLLIYSLPNPTVINNGDGTLSTNFTESVEWIDCSTGQVLGTSATFAPTVNGNYALVATNSDFMMCSDTSDCVLIDDLGLGANSVIELTLAPNPTADFITITFENPEAQLTIRDAQGKLIRTTTIYNGAIVSMINLETGVYFFEVQNEKGSVVKRVVKL